MIRNYFKIALRNLVKNKIYTGINIFGLALGLATCLLIILYISDEYSVDKHHQFGNRIFRIATESSGEYWAGTAGPYAQGLKNDFPEVETAARILKFPGFEDMLLRTGENQSIKQFYEPNGYYADSTVFDIFSYDFKYGKPQNALNQPNTLVLSETLATKIFGNENPLGKTIKVGLFFGDFNYTVSGVFKNNHKSHIDAHFFLSMQNTDLGPWVDNQKNWSSNNIFHTYVKLHDGSDARKFESMLTEFLNRNGGADLKAMGVSKQLFIQPVPDIYLNSDMGGEISPTGSMTYLYIFGMIAALLLLIACINFMNLSTARSEKRAKEVGVRKAMGAFKISLIYQFLGESLAMSILALFLALLFIQFSVPLFNELTGKNLTVSGNLQFVGWIVGITLLTGLLSGIYPAFYLSSFRPVSVLKGKLVNNISASLLRKGLVVFQFTISIVLILGAIVIWQQLSFLQNQNLGFNKNQKLIIPLKTPQAQNNYAALKEEAEGNSGIVSASGGSAYPGLSSVEDLLFYPESKSVNEAVDIRFAAIENDYTKTLDLKMLTGRTFSKQFTADSNSIILNEAAVKELGFDAQNAIGKKIYYELQNVRRNMVVVGVVQNFNFESLHNEIKPYGFTTAIANKHQYFIANVRSENYGQLLSTLQESWKKLNPESPFTYSFLDQDFQKNYEKEQRTSHLVTYFTFIAVIIACLGLFGLAIFSAEQRTKEIGIRKVLGASVMSIIGLLSREFLVLILFAILIATPLAWYGMSRWLQDFAYKIKIEWWIFAVTGILTIVIALLTVGFQSIKAALMNPVKSLKSE
ncbi:ABC transporter permease [Dyadobacter subterraneus]|uniref:ABC transporter permease n=1 Tax=Dyadobacter subterraneus TaxID=2773304 RepID=A0ABR9W9Z4_9BACT|nr:ABC transporter permease [Dyadobacter subterraneus]MBE9462272.1 ABC transporter permease [Dyadobacter subterraneus]